MFRVLRTWHIEALHKVSATIVVVMIIVVVVEDWG